MKEITLKEALKIVSFYHMDAWGWRVRSVNGSVNGDINGDVDGNVRGNVGGDVDGDIKGAVNGDIYGEVFGGIGGDVKGNVGGDINGRKWKFVETPKEKLQRLITESGSQELIDTFNQLEDNS